MPFGHQHPRWPQFQKEYSQSWHYRSTGEYVPRQGDQVIYENYFVRVVDSDPDPPRNRPKSMKPNIRFHIHFKGTQFTAAWQWKENYAAAFRGERVPQWDQQLDYVIERYGFDSRNGKHFSHPDGVHYTGFSRGSPMAMYLGGSGHGLGSNPFPAYPPAYGSDHHKISEHGFDPIHDQFFTPHLPGNMEASQRDMAVYGDRRPPHDQWGDNAGINVWRENQSDGSGRWVAQGADGNWYYVNDDGTRGRQTVKPSQAPDDDRPHPDPRADEDDDRGGKVRKTNPIVAVGDFSGLVTTFLNPVSGLIVNYKGIRRKRKFSALQRYSPFWKEQMRLTQTSVLAGPS